MVPRALDYLLKLDLILMYNYLFASYYNARVNTSSLFRSDYTAFNTGLT